ncbi:LEUCINE-RICH REPEAT RECEPTOR-LIKE PROTEIN KINASE IMK3-RELATED [Salix purpurea]|uniref:LEUCINE-RICH REPEAT RECEPTOR-LIKE PROTEIN KINASE IMK3-RELATED n=1 Tax=Salix purpurea TaxID=77065 RepID=A0A9Q0T3Q1_SALPP|nr:LEUCINE-RICH REPEAT RECEPTOR-LIKE PROTEIN KINASE IMK3-RELATED [Salix purpurea]
MNLSTSKGSYAAGMIVDMELALVGGQESSVSKGKLLLSSFLGRDSGGRISEKIGQLQALRKISLHDNVLGGIVPRSLGLLHNLRGVYLFNNRLSGSIPPSIGNCPVLQTLDVSNNSLFGTIPPSLANSTRLYRLNLSFNSLMGSIPVSLTQSPSLIFLALQHNHLSGSIPDTWGRKGNYSYHLQFLILDHNLISGTIPVSINKLALLQEISLSHNQLSGAIPNELGSLSGLQKLDFSNNAFNGSIPSGFSNLTSLVSLNLEGNRLNNQIPDGFDRLHNLSVGEIPASLIRLANLTYFNVSYNNLSGSVPSSFAKKFNSSSFVGNLQLCGYSISTPCPSPPPVVLPTPTKEEPKRHRRKFSTKDIILIAAGVLLVALLLLCIILLCCLLKKRSASEGKNGKTTMRGLPGKSDKTGAVAAPEVESGGEMGGKLVHFDGPFVFTADDLLCATAEIMGKSSYGTAYKATLEDGNQVAVKRLREKTTKGQREFETEAAALGKIRHPNLLALRAFYLGPKGEKLLVFDYMPVGSLASYLHARGPEIAVDWPTRMNIAIGVARGLNHLHTQQEIIHGNLTSSSILLDEQTDAHIAEFGLSRLMTTAANTDVISTAGTLGYRAPELSKLKNANTKTDVYSLGVIILELLTGKSPGEPINGMDLPQWVASIVKEEWTNEVFDLELMRDAQTIGDELLNTLKLALHCVDPTPTARPEADEVVQQLEEIKPELAASPADDEAKVPTNY